jgi:hypothetical protein
MASYTFQALNRRLICVGDKGNAEEIFGDGTPKREVTDVVLDFCLGKGGGLSHDSAFRESFAVLEQSGVVINYGAYGHKKLLWIRTDGLIARKMEFLRSSDFLRRTSLDGMVDFVVSEAERLSGKFGLTVKLNYHYGEEGDLAYVRKYLSR